MTNSSYRFFFHLIFSLLLLLPFLPLQVSEPFFYLINIDKKLFISITIEINYSAKLIFNHLFVSSLINFAQACGNQTVCITTLNDHIHSYHPWTMADLPTHTCAHISLIKHCPLVLLCYRYLINSRWPVHILTRRMFETKSICKKKKLN